MIAKFIGSAAQFILLRKLNMQRVRRDCFFLISALPLGSSAQDGNSFCYFHSGKGVISAKLYPEKGVDWQTLLIYGSGND